MKSVGWILPGSVGSLRLTEKSTGCVLITLSQPGSVMVTAQAEGVGVGVELGVTVAVDVAVAVGVGLGGNVAVAVAVGLAAGVGLGAPDFAQYFPPVLMASLSSPFPPQTII